MTKQPQYSQDPVLEAVIQELMSALKYYEFDGHDMPKAPVRKALEILGIPRDKQP